MLQGLKICESTKFVKDTMTKLLYLVFFINSPERHTPERFFEKSYLKFQNQNFSSTFLSRTRTVQISVCLFSLPPLHLCETRRKEELNKQSGIEVLTAKGVSDSKSYFLKNESQKTISETPFQLLTCYKSSKLKGRERNISKPLLSILC